MVRSREAVEPPFLEPLDFLGGDVRPPGGFVNGELQMQARVGERRLVGDDRLQRPCLFHWTFSFRRVGRLPFPRSSANVDVPWRDQVVAGDEPSLEVAGSGVRDERPGAAGEEHGVETDTAICSRNDVAALAAP
jgi:hypothetical protein